MKLTLQLILLFHTGLCATEELLKVDASGEVVLRFEFNSFYNRYFKSCCKVYNLHCITFVNTNGEALASFINRIQVYNYNGGLEIKISNAQKTDSGRYRCEIPRSIMDIYKDFQVEVTDSNARLNPILPLPKSTFQTSTSERHFSAEHQERDRVYWSTELTVAIVIGVVVTILFISVLLGMLYYKKKRGKGSRNLCTMPYVISQLQDHNSIVYTTVNFKPHEPASDLYANLHLQNSQNILKTEESVEYSTLVRVS